MSAVYGVCRDIIAHDLLTDAHEPCAIQTDAHRSGWPLRRSRAEAERDLAVARERDVSAVSVQEFHLDDSGDTGMQILAEHWRERALEAEATA